MKKRFGTVLISIAAAVAAVSLVACGGQNVYDDDSKIISSDSSSAVMMVNNRIGNTAKISAKSFTGVKTVFSFDANSGITVSYDAQLTSGRIKLVVCDDTEVVNIFEGTASATEEFIPLASGSYRIRLVGDEAEFSINSLTYAAS